MIQDLKAWIKYLGHNRAFNNMEKDQEKFGKWILLCAVHLYQKRFIESQVELALFVLKIADDIPHITSMDQKETKKHLFVSFITLVDSNIEIETLLNALVYLKHALKLEKYWNR